MIGAIIGDIIGSPYEGSHKKWVDDKNFPLLIPESKFTDDTVLTCATAQAIIGPSLSLWKMRFAQQYKAWGTGYPDRGYGKRFKEWMAFPKMQVVNSYANGCMMRCSPIAMFYDYNRDIALTRALQSIEYTHKSPESARGVQAIVDAIWMARNGFSKDDIKARVQEQYGHMLNMTVDEWRLKSSRDIRCNLSAPQALVCFMESTDFESAIRNAVYTKGDTDTHAAIAGALAESFYGLHTIPRHLIVAARTYMNQEMIGIVREFYKRTGPDRFDTVLDF